MRVSKASRTKPMKASENVPRDKNETHTDLPSYHAPSEVCRATKSIMYNVPKLNQVFPAGPTVNELELEVKRNAKTKSSRTLSFTDAFGTLGVPMLCILISCIAWTAWLIFLALAPNKAANMLMGTGAYDNGEFWMVSDTNPRMTSAGAVGLIIVGTCYMLVTLRMVLWREKLFKAGSRKHRSASKGKLYRWLGALGPSYKRSVDFWIELTSFQGKNRKRWNAFLKLIDLAMESIMLRQLLLNGSPSSLTYGFASFLAINSLSCAANVLTDRFSAMTEVFIDSIFDLVAAVIFPIVTLVYSYYSFDFDRDVYLTYLEKLPPGSFEHMARSYADPSEIALFRVNFDSLRISSVLDFTLRISMNLGFCYRFERVLEALIWTRHHEYAFGLMKRIVPSETTPNAVPKSVSAVFLAFSLVVLLSTHKAMSDSKKMCFRYPECVVYAHHWETSDENCPCIVLIDAVFAPKTYEEWTDPVDAFDKVKYLAASGMLKSLQLINRQLLELPEELRLCQGLKTIQLIYTSTQSLPAWTKEFEYLETIQIEGKSERQNLIELPEDLFSNMPRLSMVHLGVQSNLKRLPPLSGVPHLQTLSLAWTPLLYDLPSFDLVPKLSRLRLAIVPRLERIPDLSPLQNLVEFVIYRPCRVCCNGFVDSCDLDHISCRSNSLLNTPTATCLTNESSPTETATPFLGSVATKSAFERFAPYLCQETPFDQVNFLTFPTKETIEMCDSTPFKQCQFADGFVGICFNTRFQVLSCLPDPNYMALRRLQIEKGVGPKCDPIVEKWLGCD